MGGRLRRRRFGGGLYSVRRGWDYGLRYIGFGGFFIRLRRTGIGQLYFVSRRAGSCINGLVRTQCYLCCERQKQNDKPENFRKTHLRETEVKPGTLYVVATPIGNLRDITLRALDVLGKVDRIVAEDTRNTAVLLRHYGLQTKLQSLHQHNERERAVELVAQLAGGASLALVSDAGTPGISDPGALLICSVRQAGYDVVPVPGASALAAALSVSGMHALPFNFYGFLPAKSSARKTALQDIQSQVGTLIFYEAPHRVLDCVADVCAVFGSLRQMIIARELTKLFETVHACPLSEAVAWLNADTNRVRGEFVLIVEGAPHVAAASEADMDRVLLPILAEQLPVKQAAKLCAAILDVGKNAAYERALALKNSLSKN